MGKVHIPSEMELESWPVPPARGQHQQWWWVFIYKKVLAINKFVSFVSQPPCNWWQYSFNYLNLWILNTRCRAKSTVRACLLTHCCNICAKYFLNAECWKIFSESWMLENIFWILNVGKCSGQNRPRPLSRLDQATIVEGKGSPRTDMYDKNEKIGLIFMFISDLIYINCGHQGYITITFCPFRLPRTVWTMEPM